MIKQYAARRHYRKEGFALDISFVIPCYRSEQTIERVVTELFEVMQSHAPSMRFEIILVNDSSPDRVMDRIAALCERHTNILGIDLSRNFGQPSALLAGYAYTRGDHVCCIDDDGQTPVEMVFPMLEKLKEGYDAVFADYTGGKQHTRFRNLGSRVNQKMAEIVYHKPKGMTVSSFVIMRRYIVEQMMRYRNPFPNNSGLILMATGRVASIPAVHRKRIAGTSGYTVRKLIGLWTNSLFNFSIIPLRISMALGVISMLIGFVLAILFTVNKIANPSVPMGWTSSIVVLLLLGGIILIMMGIIGEYIGRVFLSINNVPQYVVRRVYGLPPDPQGAGERAQAAPLPEEKTEAYIK